MLSLHYLPASLTADDALQLSNKEAVIVADLPKKGFASLTDTTGTVHTKAGIMTQEIEAIIPLAGLSNESKRAVMGLATAWGKQYMAKETLLDEVALDTHASSRVDADAKWDAMHRSTDRKAAQAFDLVFEPDTEMLR